MNRKTRSGREERLRAVLRQGDPAGTEPGLAPEEVRRMRRAILAAPAETAEPRRGGFWLPALATAAAAALILALTLGLWRVHTHSAVRPLETGRQAVAVPEPAIPEEMAAPPAAVPAPPTDHLPAQAPRRPRPRRPALEPARLASAPEASPIPDVEPDSFLAPDEPPAEPPLRQVQLEAPGGTRVIWMLSTESVVENLAD